MKRFLLLLVCAFLGLPRGLASWHPALFRLLSSPPLTQPLSCVVPTAPAPLSGQPTNDMCTSSTSLTVNAPAVTGSVFDATSDRYCFGARTAAFGRGVWYSFIGHGNIVTVSTCSPDTNFDARLAVQSGGCNADCVDDKDVGAAVVPCENSLARELTFDTVPDRLYAVFVYGASSSNVLANATAAFAISVVDYQPPVNDNCSAATPLLDDGPAIGGTTVNATEDTYCFRQGLDPVDRGVWYVVDGTGTQVSVSTCFASTNLRTRMGIQDGGCLGSCVAVTTTLCEENSFGTTLTWQSIADQPYYVFVFGGFSTSGDYDIRTWAAPATIMPTTSPTISPTNSPTLRPTLGPTPEPTPEPTPGPTNGAILRPTPGPTETSPSISNDGDDLATTQPTRSPSANTNGGDGEETTATPSHQFGDGDEATPTPTAVPPNIFGDGDEVTAPPTPPIVEDVVTRTPSAPPTMTPSKQPSMRPSVQPSTHPSGRPSVQPTGQPSMHPSMPPSSQPSAQPSTQPSDRPSAHPSEEPSLQPSGHPSYRPSMQPSVYPSAQPSSQPSLLPSVQPSVQPSVRPSEQPFLTEATLTRSGARHMVSPRPLVVGMLVWVVLWL